MSDPLSQTTLLEKPTVGDLIRALSAYPASQPLRIEDADTNWTIGIIHIRTTEKCVWLFGEYGEMAAEPELEGDAHGW